MRAGSARGFRGRFAVGSATRPGGGAGARARARAVGGRRQPRGAAAPATLAVGGPPADTLVERRLEITTAATTIPIATTATPVRSPGLWLYLTTLVAISSATRFMTLISGLMAGPAVSLNGSPTVSPMMVASCASEPLPPKLPSSTSFLALSQAPPELARNTAISAPAAMAPARKEPSGA